MIPASDLLVVITTLPGDRPELADAIARTLVSEGLAACVQVLPPMTSTYRWQGELCVDRECLVLLKTLADRYADLEARLRSLHPYDEPEIVALPAAEASAGYLAWVASVVRP